MRVAFAYEEATREGPPEQALMLAVVDDGVMALLQQGNDRDAQRLRDEAAAWFASDDREWPFSFLNLCDALQLDATAVRAALAAKAQAPATTAVGTVRGRHQRRVRRWAGDRTYCGRRPREIARTPLTARDAAPTERAAMTTQSGSLLGAATYVPRPVAAESEPA
jgi:hypothetical protein